MSDISPFDREWKSVTEQYEARPERRLWKHIDLLADEHAHDLTLDS